MSMRILIPVLFSILLLGACNEQAKEPLVEPVVVPRDGIWVRVENQTGEDLVGARLYFRDSLYAVLGDIPAATITDYKQYDSFPIGTYTSGMKFPLEDLFSAIGGVEERAWSGVWCGTGVTETLLPSGEYTLLVSKTISGNKAYYLMGFK